MDKITGIVYLIIILSILVIVHEWGHFIVARYFKMRVEEFALFFGKVIWRLGKRGDTEYNVRAVPLGGFVRIAGMEPDDISGGRPVLEALRNPRMDSAEGMDKLLRQLDADTMAGIDPAEVSPEVRQLVREAVGPNGQLLPERIEDLEIKQASPQLSASEKKLIQMVLQAEARSTDPGLYNQKPIYQRALTIFGGPFMSLLFGYFVFCMLGMTVGLPMGQTTNQIQVDPSGVAQQAGLLTGDRIVAVNGEPTPRGELLTEKIRANPGKPIQLTIERKGRQILRSLTPRAVEDVKRDSKGAPVMGPDGKPVKQTIGRIGVVPSPEMKRLGPLESLKSGTIMTVDYVRLLGTVLFSKKVKDNVGGPIAMGQQAIALQRLGIAPLLFMMASFSLSLGIMNLLPIPILDGGHLLLLAVEKVRRRKLTPREVYRAQMVGLAMLAVMVVLVMGNDIFRTIAGKGFQ
jgi:regulator of sigma E protease